ncbi:hypothetical protein [Streptomyces sp. NPDC047024]|uniref:hypothetical protein n=1 Tax=Streptomyces sp. NPDC047024 TaxID=3155476 RepID=UPI0033ED87C0
MTPITLPAEVPDGMHLCGSWYAVPTGDQDAVLEAFGLAEPEPVTLRAGAEAWKRDQHVWDRRPHARCSRVFVSPVLDGWTLVFGHSSPDAHEIADGGEADFRRVVRRRCTGLSRRFGAAHWYAMNCGDDWTGWCIAEGGEVVRHYDADLAETGGDDGPGHPAEEGYLLPHQRPLPQDAVDTLDLDDPHAFIAGYLRLREELGVPDTCYAKDIAARLSVDPAALGPHTRVAGRGVLALTACGREHGIPGGEL